MVFFSYAENLIIPEYIKVAIRSGSNAVSTVFLSTDHEFVFGYRYNKDFVRLYDFDNMNKLYVRKDSYYIHTNGYFYEYNFVNSKDENNRDITGPIHIQIGGSFKSKSEAKKLMDHISALGLKPYLALEESWRIWIGAYTTYDNAEKEFDELRAIISEDLTVISKDSSRVQITDEEGKIILIYNPSYGDYYFEPRENDFITIDNKLFRGSIMLKNALNGNLTIINRLSIDQYLYGVLPKEMTHTYPIEALKAQAIAARTYAIANINKHKNEGFHLCASTHCQAYGGYTYEETNTNLAVDATSRKILIYNGLPISTFYHHHSGGHTESSENIWGERVDYLRGVEDNFGENYLWNASFTANDLSQLLISNGYNIGQIKDVYIDAYSEYGSVLKLVIQGTEGIAVLEKNNIRKVLGYNTIKSLKFSLGNDNSISIINANTRKSVPELTGLHVIDNESQISKITNNNSYIFNGKKIGVYQPITKNNAYEFIGTGYGHSIGMSQSGAKAMAAQGYSYEEILYHYYTNVTLIDY